MEENEEVLKISPKFSFAYELFMPTGRKIKNSLLIALLFTILTIMINTSNFFFNSLSVSDSIIKTGIVVIDIFLYIILAVNVIMKVLQYKYITYTFYKEYLIYEDSFLNQHRKKIMYSNVKEVELRRTVWDRIFGFGIIIIHTNAENGRNNGLVVYGIKTPEDEYAIIDGLIHDHNNKEKEINAQKEDLNKDIDSTKEFKDSLKN